MDMVFIPKEKEKEKEREKEKEIQRYHFNLEKWKGRINYDI